MSLAAASDKKDTGMWRKAATMHARNCDISVQPAFDFLSSEYRELYAASDASAFQAPLWLSMLHERLAPRLKAVQHTIIVRSLDDQRLLAVLPLINQSSAGIAVVQPIDFGLCDRNDIVAERSTLEALAGDADALTQLRAAIRHADLLLFRKIWESGFDIALLFPRAQQRRAPNSAYVCDTGTDFEAWQREHMRKKMTKELGRLQRQTERDFESYEHRLVTSESEIREAFEFMRALRRGRYADNLLDDERYFSFYLDYAIAAAKCGEAATYVSYIGGVPAAVLFGLSGDGEYHAVLIGADVEKFERQSTGIQLLYRVIGMRVRDGHETFDMGLGNPGYKSHFRPREVPVFNLTRAVSPTGSAIAMIYHRSKPLKDFIKGILPNVR